MPPLSRQTTIFLQSKLTEELNSELFWTDGVVSSAFREETLRLFEGSATPLEASPTLPISHLLSLSDDEYLGPHSVASDDAERVNFVGFTSDACTMPYVDQPDELYATFTLPS